MNWVLIEETRSEKIYRALLFGVGWLVKIVYTDKNHSPAVLFIPDPSYTWRL